MLPGLLEARSDSGSLPTACPTLRDQPRDVIQKAQGDAPPDAMGQPVLAGSTPSGEASTTNDLRPRSLPPVSIARRPPRPTFFRALLPCKIHVDTRSRHMTMHPWRH